MCPAALVDLGVGGIAERGRNVMTVPVLPQHQTQRHRQRRVVKRRPRSLQQKYCGPLLTIGILSMALTLMSVMIFNFLFSRKNNAAMSSAAISNNPLLSSSNGKIMYNNNPSSELENRMKGALWGFFSGDALASPTHWYYGGYRQIQNDYGSNGIQDYTKPKFQLIGSILNKSDMNSGGRSSKSSSKSSSNNNNKKRMTIIGDVINHGKEDLWHPSKHIHYHATLHKGEPTLEVQLARVLMKSIVATNGIFDKDHFRQAYIDFMTTPNSHNDTYASTCHRMFFANLYFRNLDPINCPDNDHHNVDAIDGLVLPTIVALATSGRQLFATEGTTSTTSTSEMMTTDSNNRIMEQVSEASSMCAAVTRKSSVLEYVAGRWGQLVAASIQSSSSPPLLLDHYDNDISLKEKEMEKENNNSNFRQTLDFVAQQTIRRSPNPNKAARLDQLMTACYLDQSLPPLLDMVSKYLPSSSQKTKTGTTTTTFNTGPSSSSSSPPPSGTWVWNALLDNANVGGENVHRGSVFGAILGARAGMTNLPPHLIQGLYNYQELEEEINEFCAAVLHQ